jgi:hypothetical protein
MDAASTASAPACSAATMCSGPEAPPEAMMGTYTAAAASASSAKS